MTRLSIQYGTGLVMLACCWSLTMPAGELLAAVSTAVPKEVQGLYDKKEYQKALEELAKLDKETAAAPNIRRLRVRALVAVGNPKEALEEYDKLHGTLKQDDEPLLREVALGFIIVMMKDMREQMRGAAYTALKEIDSEDVVPLFEDGLSEDDWPRITGATKQLQEAKIFIDDTAALMEHSNRSERGPGN